MSSPSIDQAVQKALEHHRAGRLAEAEAGYRRVLGMQAEHPEALHLLGALAQQVGKFELAIDLMRRAARLLPGRADIHNNLGAALRAAGDVNGAVMEYQLALRLDAGHVDARANLADVYGQIGQHLHGRMQIDEAIEAYRAVVSLEPGRAGAHNNLGNALRDRADFPAALAEYRRAIDLAPDLPVLHSNLLYNLWFDPDQDLASIVAEHERFNRMHVERIGSVTAQHQNDRDPDRRLRIGYVSPDFRLQAEAYFVIPLLEAHDRGAFEVHCYSSIERPDAVTDRHRRAAEGWHDVAELSDEALAERIRADRIDILIDLTMHMRGNRLLTFARRPAPVQFTWLAYPGTTGLKAIDYRLTDAYIEPKGADDSWSAERPMRLPDSWCCYDPLTEAPAVNDLPAKASGNVTFGSLNHFCKHNDRVARLWGRVMGQVPGSRLVMMCGSEVQRRRILGILGESGVADDRVEFVIRMSGEDYLRTYQRIDIALDPFPYNGITTTCDALWMGVPVVSLAGELPPARAGLSLLSAVGLPELMANGEEHFVRIATSLAADLPRLAELRTTLRGRMEESPLMDSKRFARNVEAAYRVAWRRWASCDTAF